MKSYVPIVRKYGPTTLAAGLALGGSLAGAQELDPSPIASAAVTTIGGVMGAGAAVLAASVGGRIAVKWIKRLVGMA